MANPDRPARQGSWLPLGLALIVLVFALSLAVRAYFVSGDLEPTEADSAKDVQSLTARAFQAGDLTVFDGLACPEFAASQRQALADFFADARTLAEQEQVLLGFDVQGDEPQVDGDNATFTLEFEVISPLTEPSGALQGAAAVDGERWCLSAATLDLE